ELAHGLNVTYREGFIRNRYIGRTFIMPGQTIRKKSVRQKLSVVGLEFKDKNVLIVDDSIVRGTTGREIVQMAREAGASKVFFASAAPPVRFPNVYGIDMPTRAELIATGRNEEQVAREIGADAVIYQDLDALKDAVRTVNPKLTQFETSCFDGVYITGDVTSEYLASIERQRDAGRQESMENAAEAADRFCNNAPGNIYSRFTNPTVTAFQERLAALEGAQACVATASGMSAILATAMATLKAGDHVVCSSGVFGATVQLFSTVLSRFGIETTYADGTQPSTWRAAMKPNTRLLFLETPSNPLTEVFDISALAQIARGGGALLVVDNCFCTPALQRPFELVADLVIH